MLYKLEDDRNHMQITRFKQISEISNHVLAKIDNNTMIIMMMMMMMMMMCSPAQDLRSAYSYSLM